MTRDGGISPRQMLHRHTHFLRPQTSPLDVSSTCMIPAMSNFQHNVVPLPVRSKFKVKADSLDEM